MEKGIHEGTIGIPQGDGKYKIAHYWIKAYERKSKWGINGGKISKLTIRIDGKFVVNYDRGWDIKPDEEDHDAMVAYCICLESYN